MAFMTDSSLLLNPNYLSGRPLKAGRHPLPFLNQQKPGAALRFCATGPLPTDFFHLKTTQKPGKPSVPAQARPWFVRLPLGIGWLMRTLGGWSALGPMPITLTARDLRREFRTLPTAEAFEAYLSKSVTPYLGTLPKELTDTGLPGQLVFNALGTVAQILAPFSLKPEIEMTVRLGEKQLTFKKAGSGQYGRVYKLTIRGADGTVQKDYALKAYFERSKVKPLFQYHRHGKAAELGSALFMSPWKFNDLARFYCGDAQAGWALYDWVDEKSGIETRFGRSARLFLDRLGLEFSDNEDWQKNSLSGVRVDYGGISPKQVIPGINTINNKVTFHALARDYLTRQQYAYEIDQLKEPLKKQAYEVLMNYADCWEQLKNSFPMPKANPNPVDAQYDAMREQIVAIFEKAVKDPLKQKEAAHLLFYLPSTEARQKAFKALLAEPDCWDSLEPALNIVRLADKPFFYSAVLGAFNQGLQSPENRLKAMRLYPALSDEDRASVLKAVSAYPDCLAALVGRDAFSIPKAMVKQVFFDNMQNPAITNQALRNLQALPEKADRDTFFQQAVLRPETRLEALSALSTLTPNGLAAVNEELSTWISSLLSEVDPDLTLVSFKQ